MKLCQLLASLFQCIKISFQPVYFEHNKFSSIDTPLLGETNTEHPKKVTISGLDINMSLDHGLPFLDHRAEFVTGQIHAVEVGQNIASLNFFSHQFELPEGYFIILKISQGDLKHSPLQTIRSNPCKTQINKFKIVSFYLPKYIDGMLCAFLNTEKG